MPEKNSIMPEVAVAVDRQIVAGVDFHDRRQVAVAETPEDAQRIADALNWLEIDLVGAESDPGHPLHDQVADLLERSTFYNFQSTRWEGNGPTPEEAGDDTLLFFPRFDHASMWESASWDDHLGHWFDSDQDVVTEDLATHWIRQPPLPAATAAVRSPAPVETCVAAEDLRAGRMVCEVKPPEIWEGDGPTPEEVGGDELHFWCSRSKSWLRATWEDEVFGHPAWGSIDNGLAKSTATHWRPMPPAP